jgi:hypothetical protein
MSSSATQSQSVSFTVADIGKVIDCFAADLDMNAQSTGLLTWDVARKSAGDVKLMAQNGYLIEANIVLADASGTIIRAGKYEVATNVGTLTAQRPGNNLWPRTVGGQLYVVVRYSQTWRNLTETQRAAFIKTLNISWSAANTDLSFPGLTRSSDRSYVSNGWGVTKSVFK